MRYWTYGIALGLVLGLATSGCVDDGDREAASTRSSSVTTESDSFVNPHGEDLDKTRHDPAAFARVDFTPIVDVSELLEPDEDGITANIDFATFHVMDPAGIGLENVRVDIRLREGVVLEGWTDEEGDLSWDMDVLTFPFEATFRREGLVAYTTLFTRDIVVGTEVWAQQVPVVLMPKKEQPHWVEVSGTTANTGQMPSMVTVSSSVPGTNYTGAAPFWDVRVEPGVDFTLVAAQWMPNAPNGVITPDGHSFSLQRWVVLPMGEAKGGEEARLDFAEAYTEVAVARGLIVLPQWAQVERARPLHAWMQVSSRDSDLSLVAGMPTSMERHPVVPGFAYTTEYLPMKELGSPVTSYTLFNGEVESTITMDGYPARGLARLDFPKPPNMLNAAVQISDTSLTWQMSAEELSSNEKGVLVVLLENPAKELAWVGVVNPRIDSLSFTAPPESDIDGGVMRFDIPEAAFDESGTWTASVAWCTWEGEFGGHCDRSATGRDTKIVIFETYRLNEEIIRFDVFPFDKEVPFYGYPTPDPINPYGPMN